MAYQELLPYLEKMASLSHAMGIISFDRSTLGIKKAGANASKTQSFLSKELMEVYRDPSLKKILEDCLKENLEFSQKRIVEEILDEITKAEKVPADLQLKYRQACWKASEVWPTFKHNSDWNGFIPYVKEVVDLEKEKTKYLVKEGQSYFDVLLDDYMPGFDTKTLDHFFDLLKKEIVPLLKQIQSKPVINDSFMHQEFDPKAQEVYTKELVAKLGFDFESGAIFESEHPFTSHFNNHDVRFTNHYHTDNLHSIYSAIHESGHALYEMGISDELTRTPVGHGTSTDMHESQSRFYENMIGRNPSFIKNEYPNIQKVFPQFKDVALEDYILASNVVKPGLIRIEADELTYSLHIMIRYEIEKEMFENDIDYQKLPELWNQKVKDFLGLEVPNDDVGILQDMHWGSGLIGYFPGYSLGSAIAAQLYETFKKTIDIETLIEKEDYATIRETLRENIHQYGRLYSTQELLERVTGERFNPEYYVKYLKNKFTKLYNL